jgi:hypothetical protein
LNTINFRAPRELPIIYSLRNLNNNNNQNEASITSRDANEINGLVFGKATVTLNNSTRLKNQVKTTSLPSNLDDTFLEKKNYNDVDSNQIEKKNKLASNDTLLVSNSSVQNDLLPPTSNPTIIISISTSTEQKRCELYDEKKKEKIVS